MPEGLISKREASTLRLERDLLRLHLAGIKALVIDVALGTAFMVHKVLQIFRCMKQRRISNVTHNQTRLTWGSRASNGLARS